MNSIKLTKKGSGFALRYGDVEFCLDTSASGTTTLLSHSHADHTGTLSKASRVIATNGTIDTLRARGGTPTWESGGTNGVSQNFIYLYIMSS